jgi:hypothetical protein
MIRDLQTEWGLMGSLQKHIQDGNKNSQTIRHAVFII